MVVSSFSPLSIITDARGKPTTSSAYGVHVHVNSAGRIIASHELAPTIRIDAQLASLALSFQLVRLSGDSELVRILVGSSEERRQLADSLSFSRFLSLSFSFCPSPIRENRVNRRATWRTHPAAINLRGA